MHNHYYHFRIVQAWTFLYINSGGKHGCFLGVRNVLVFKEWGIAGGWHKYYLQNLIDNNLLTQVISVKGINKLCSDQLSLERLLTR